MPAHLLQGLSDLNRAAYNERPIGSGPFRSRCDGATATASRWQPIRSIGAASRASIASSIGSFPIQIRGSNSCAPAKSTPISTWTRSSCRKCNRFPRIGIALTPVNDLHVLRFNLRDPVVRDVRRPSSDCDGDRSRNAARRRYPRQRGYRQRQSAPQRLGLRRGHAVDSLRSRRRETAAGGTNARADARDCAADSQRIAARGLGHSRGSAPNRHSRGHQAVPERDVLRAGCARRRTCRRTLSALVRRLVGARERSRRLVEHGLRQVPPTGLNYSFWCDPRADAAMHDALASVDRTRRRADYAIVQRAIARDLPIFTLWQVRIPNAYRTYVQGIAPAPGGSTFWNAWSWRLDD